MPDGRTHDAITLVTASFAAPLCVGLAFDGNPGRAALALGAFLMSGLFFSDDLDIHSIEFRRWRMLRFLWLPYQKLIPHRSWLSHGLIVGAALRIGYFAGMCTLALWLLLTALSRVLPLDASGVLGDLLSAIARSIMDHPEWWGLAFAAFALGSVVHIVSDTLWTFWRRAWRGPFVRPAYMTEEPTHHGAPAPDYAVRVSYNVREGDSPS
jgi:uncharacterized metal-binding protein